ncbi:MAG TPA: LapA family protein [Candidatus Paceibacterota bacterium]|nr:LapA family protein [Candidatus Paceibacterota bacterium]HRZ34519.1 LapA family protein [Candidatus Paceibacterota bacterium]
MLIIRIIFVLLIFALGLLFSFQNIAPAQIVFLAWNFQSPTWLVIAVSFFLGFIIPLGILLPMVLVRNLKIRKLEKEKAVAEKRLNDSGLLFESPGLGTEGEKYKNS